MHPLEGILQFKDGSKLHGIVKALLIPPEDVSPYFAHNFGSQEKPNRKYCVCFSCAKEKENLKFCHHKNAFERAITITTTVAELNYGLSKKKYQLLQLCELYSFQKGVSLFKGFVQNDEDFKRGLTDQIMLKFVKAGLVSSYGYFMLKKREEKQKLCATLLEFQNLLKNFEVVDFDAINDHYLDVSFKNASPSQSDCFSNLIMGAHISAYSRMIVDQKITSLKERFKSMKVYMTNVDAIAFSLNSHEDISCLKLDDEKIGAFKSEIKNLGEILSFHALSPYSYNLSFVTQSGEMKNLSKICGFSLNSSINSEFMNQELSKEMISNALKGKKTSIMCTQVRQFCNKNTNDVERKILQYQLRNTLFKKRVVMDDYSTLPLGYTKNMANVNT